MVLSTEQEKELKKAIEEIEFGEITIKAQGKSSYVDIVVSQRKRIHAEEIEANDCSKYNKG